MRYYALPWATCCAARVSDPFLPPPSTAAATRHPPPATTPCTPNALNAPAVLVDKALMYEMMPVAKRMNDHAESDGKDEPADAPSDPAATDKTMASAQHHRPSAVAVAMHDLACLHAAPWALGRRTRQGPRACFQMGRSSLQRRAN